MKMVMLTCCASRARSTSGFTRAMDASQELSVATSASGAKRSSSFVSTVLLAAALSFHSVLEVLALHICMRNDMYQVHCPFKGICNAYHLALPERHTCLSACLSNLLGCSAKGRETMMSLIMC